ncbi:hypothetical protein KDL44_08565 [bacterium]|nr:hypothetical protein [bacterium]
MQEKWPILAIAILLSGLLAACGGGSADPEPLPQQGSLGGSITVEGAALADLGSGLNPGALDPGKIGVRVIEPIIDIDAIEIETSGGTLNITEVPPGTAKLLQLELLPAEDLSGGSAASTPVQLSIPLNFVAGELTSIAAEVSFEQEAASASHVVSQAGRGWYVRLRYTISGPGATTRSLRIRWNDSTVQYDSNLDMQFSDEDSFADSDRDGLGDELRELVNDQASDREIVERSGLISELLPAQHGILLDSGLRIGINELTRIRINGAAARPGALHVGDSCTVRGYLHDADGIRALEIDVTPQSDVSSRR